MNLSLAERYWAKVDQRGPDECWPWTGALSGNGYGYIRDADGRVAPAPRVGLILDGRDPGPGGMTRHTCDAPVCCNPAHLLPGTQAENMLDMAVRGRGAKKLTVEIVRSIRQRVADGESQVSVARSVGVSTYGMSQIIRRRRWAHVTDVHESRPREQIAA